MSGGRPRRHRALGLVLGLASVAPACGQHEDLVVMAAGRWAAGPVAPVPPVALARFRQLPVAPVATGAEARELEAALERAQAGLSPAAAATLAAAAARLPEGRLRWLQELARVGAGRRLEAAALGLGGAAIPRLALAAAGMGERVQEATGAQWARVGGAWAALDRAQFGSARAAGASEVLAALLALPATRLQPAAARQAGAQLAEGALAVIASLPCRRAGHDPAALLARLLGPMAWLSPASWWPLRDAIARGAAAHPDLPPEALLGGLPWLEAWAAGGQPPPLAHLVMVPSQVAAVAAAARWAAAGAAAPPRAWELLLEAAHGDGTGAALERSLAAVAADWGAEGGGDPACSAALLASLAGLDEGPRAAVAGSLGALPSGRRWPAWRAARRLAGDSGLWPSLVAGLVARAATDPPADLAHAPTLSQAGLGRRPAAVLLEVPTADWGGHADFLGRVASVLGPAERWDLLRPIARLGAPEPAADDTAGWPPEWPAPARWLQPGLPLGQRRAELLALLGARQEGVPSVAAPVSLAEAWSRLGPSLRRLAAAERGSDAWRGTLVQLDAAALGQVAGVPAARARPAAARALGCSEEELPRRCRRRLLRLHPDHVDRQVAGDAPAARVARQHAASLCALVAAWLEAARADPAAP